STLWYLKVFLRWCGRQRLIVYLPHIEMPRNSTKVGGRLITLEEFERMLAAVPKLFWKLDHAKEIDLDALANDKAQADAKAGPWRLLLRGLWTGGWRLGEALAMSWDQSAPVAVLGLDGKRPVVRIDAAFQKGGRQTETPAVPEFAELLRESPATTGYVFAGLPSRRVDNVSKTISAIASKANVAATAHDLRRSFGARWSRRLEAQALRQLMRHKSIQTTLAFYATDDCGLAD